MDTIKFLVPIFTIVYQPNFISLQINEVKLSVVSRKYGANKGMLQSLQQAASTFAGMVTRFCSRLGWLNLELLIGQYQERFQFGIQVRTKGDDLYELLEVSFFVSEILL